jgi:hypothetical protein
MLAGYEPAVELSVSFKDLEIGTATSFFPIAVTCGLQTGLSAMFEWSFSRETFHGSGRILRYMGS